MDKMYFLPAENLYDLLKALSGQYSVFVPIKKNGRQFFQAFSPDVNNVEVGGVRTAEPIKSFFFRSREIVAKGFSSAIPGAEAKPLALIGVKACDLKGFKIQDYVYNAPDSVDPFYAKNRNDNLIVSADCTYVIDTCFCDALGIQPSPQENFDLNLSGVTGGYVVTLGSTKGEGVVAAHQSLFQDVSESMNEEVAKKRAAVLEDVKRNITKNNVPYQEKLKGAVEKQYEADIWKDEAKTCVECGACNTICPTCHCFLLYDQKNEQELERLRIWDSCMLKNFARVAGGANPREYLWMRLRNRFEKKFDYFPKVADVYACTGCGRCISACPAKIDIRKVLNRLVNNA